MNSFSLVQKTIPTRPDNFKTSSQCQMFHIIQKIAKQRHWVACGCFDTATQVKGIARVEWPRLENQIIFLINKEAESVSLLTFRSNIAIAGTDNILN